MFQLSAPGFQYLTVCCSDIQWLDLLEAFGSQISERFAKVPLEAMYQIESFPQDNHG